MSKVSSDVLREGITGGLLLARRLPPEHIRKMQYAHMF
jgi:hypothetical protein